MPQMGILLLALLLVLSHSASAFSAVEGKSIAILQNNGGGEYLRLVRRDCEITLGI